MEEPECLRGAFSIYNTSRRLGQSLALVSLYLLYQVRVEANHGTITTDKRLFVLGFIQMCFEGSMYLFVFLWVPFLQEAASPNHALPLGYIFSSFMLSMTFGALLYGAVVSLNEPSPMADVSSSSHDDERTVAFHAKLSSAVCAVGAFAFIISTATRHERLRFWAFCAYEACVGVYYPVQGMLRGKLVPDEHRATVRVLVM